MLFVTYMVRQQLMDDVHHLTARHLRYELRGVKIFSSKFGAGEVCIASQRHGSGSDYGLVTLDTLFTVAAVALYGYAYPPSE